MLNSGFRVKTSSAFQALGVGFLLLIVSLAGCGKPFVIIPAPIDAKPGTLHPIWRFKTRGPILVEPLLQGNDLYLGSLDRSVYKLNLDKPGLVWKKKLKAPAAQMGIDVNGHLLIMTSIPETRLYQLLANRKEVWVHPIGEAASEMALDDSLLFVSTELKRFLAIRIATGETQWDFKADDAIHTRPLLSQKRVIFGTEAGQIVALNAVDGKQQWLVKHTAAFNVDPVLADSLTIFAAEDNTLLCLRVSDGTEKWRTQLTGINLNPPLFVNEQLIVHSLTGQCFFIDIQTGQLQESIQCPTLVTPLIQYGQYLIWVEQQKGEISLFNLKTRTVDQQYLLDETVRVCPVIWRDLLLVPTTGNKLIVVQLPHL